jgi:hypothetical protein
MVQHNGIYCPTSNSHAINVRIHGNSCHDFLTFYIYYSYTSFPSLARWYSNTIVIFNINCIISNIYGMAVRGRTIYYCTRYNGLKMLNLSDRSASDIISCDMYRCLSFVSDWAVYFQLTWVVIVQLPSSGLVYLFFGKNPSHKALIQQLLWQTFECWW